MLKILSGGIQTLIEEPKGRTGYLDLGIAHSGTMDHFSGRAANLIVENDINEAVIEITGGLFTAEFEEDTVIAITGGDFGPTLNGEKIPMWEAIQVKKGDVVKSGNCGKGSLGFRQYWSFAGGIDVPLFLGSKSTAIYGGFGGYEGRALKKGDNVKLIKPTKDLNGIVGRKFKQENIPQYSKKWEMRAIPGPNAAPDYFTEEGLELYFSEELKSQVFADRSGIRFTGPKPIFAKERMTGGGHPSNVMDQGYPGPGCINMSGETPILFPRECPTSGGFACMLSVIYADQWIMGQIVPGTDSIKFIYCTPEEALKARKEQNELLTEKSIIR